MTTTYTWTIQSLPTTTEDGHDDVVCQANWLCTATDGTNTASLPGTSTFAYDPAATYTPRASVTEQQALGWVWEKVNKDDIQSYLDAQLAVTTPALPWSTTEAP
jgi:hypothetical protein